MITVLGRVQAGATVRRPDGIEPCVVATTWASDRPFPRTAGHALPFEVQADGGQRFAVDPAHAAVALPVRARQEQDGAVREVAWIGPGDEVVIEGVSVTTSDGGPATLRATRISASGDGAPARTPHRLPPGALARALPDPGGPVDAIAADGAPVPLSTSDPAEGLAAVEPAPAGPVHEILADLPPGAEPPPPVVDPPRPRRKRRGPPGPDA